MDTEKKQKLKKEMKGLALGAFGLFIFLSLISFHADDPSFNSYSSLETARNFGGIVGADIADLLWQQGFGFAAFVIPLALCTFAYKLLRFKEISWRYYNWIALGVLLIALSTLFAFFKGQTVIFGQQVSTGGWLGSITAELTRNLLGTPGAFLVLLTLLAVAIIVLSHFSFVQCADWWLTSINEWWRRFQERRARELQAAKQPTSPAEQGVAKIKVQKPSEPPELRPAPKKEKRPVEDKGVPLPEPFEFIKADGAYQTPPLSLLDVPAVAEQQQDEEALAMNARLLENKFKDFGVTGEVVEILPGPVITMYEFAPGPGVKVNRVAGLADDLSMALQALSIRIVAPIPGKGVVGIEIPNREREMVALKEIFSCEEFHRGKLKLPLALGKDIAGVPSVTDLARMPHLLVAGATGSGKSVSINTMILSLLYTATPHDVRLIMVDPKMLELSVYEGIPHLLLPVVTNPKKAALALKWAVKEMERRYRLMSDKGVRNIDSYNKRLERDAQEEEANRDDGVLLVDAADEIEQDDEAAIQAFLNKEEELEHGHLPYIVVIVDELADLMMVAGREIEESIARLAQMARAAGIHLILATQRPSVDVITGLIKANFPARISFQVSSKTDSRTILDCNGAEALLGAGDMLFLPPGTAKMQRIHGAFVSDAEVQRVVEFLKKQAKPVYETSIMEMKEASGNEPDDEEVDECYDKAVALVAEARQASISMVQRRLRIGYNRAARIIEKMEQEGIIGPSDGTSKPREVFINKL